MKNLKKLAALLLALTMVFALAACGGSDTDTDNGGEAKEKLTVGTSADYAPFEFHKMIDGKDTILGADIELAQKIADDLGMELVIKDIAFDTLLNELQGGTVDVVIAGMNADEERVQQATPSDAYYSEVNQMLVIRTEDADTYKAASDFDGVKVAVQAGTIFPGVAEQNLTGCETLILQAVPDIFNNLINGKCDAALVDGNVGQGYIDANDGLVAVDIEFPMVDGMSAWVQKDDPKGLLESINKSIAEIAEAGTYEQWLAEAEEQSAE